MTEGCLPRKFYISDFNQVYAIPTQDVPHKKSYRVWEKLEGLLQQHYSGDDVVRRFREHDIFYGPNKITDTMLFANDWVLPYATCWLLTPMIVNRPNEFRIEVPEIEEPLAGALVEIPVRVTEEKSPLASMFRLAFLSGLEDLK